MYSTFFANRPYGRAKDTTKFASDVRRLKRHRLLRAGIVLRKKAARIQQMVIIVKNAQVCLVPYFVSICALSALSLVDPTGKAW